MLKAIASAPRTLLINKMLSPLLKPAIIVKARFLITSVLMLPLIVDLILKANFLNISITVLWTEMKEDGA